MNFEAPLTSLVWLTSIVSVALTFILSKILIPDIAGDKTLWWKLSAVITCGTLAGAIIPEFVKVFTSTGSRHVREVVTASREGGASLNILSGFVAGNFSAYWLGMSIVVLMGIGYTISTSFPSGIMLAPAVFAFGLVAFGFLGMGPVTIAVDSYGPVTDNAQSVFELSTIEQIRGIDEGGEHRSISRGGIHQGEYQVGGHDKGVGERFQKSGRDLHAICAEGDVQYLLDGVLRYVGFCIPGTVFLYRVSDFDSTVRSVPGDLHGQCRRGLGQR